MEHKGKLLGVVLEKHLPLRAELRIDTGRMTVTVPPPWDAVRERRARQLQQSIQEWSKEHPELVCYCFDPFSTLLYRLP